MSEEYVIFRANPACCPRCSEIDGQKFPVSVNLYDISHPNCKCSLESDGQQFPVSKLLDAAAAVFDPEETEKDIEEGADPADPKTSRRAGATFKTIKESYLPMLVLDKEDGKKVKNCEHCESLEQQAMNDTLNEEFYTGFQYTNQPEGDIPPNTVETTYDFGSTLVQISPLGDFFGSDREGNAVPEKVTVESLRNLIKNIDGEILVDFDHSSECSTDTRAAAWASDFMVVENLGNSSGLYGRLKWTKEGREAAMERKYRFLSPVWELGENNEPVKLISIALTNKPALKGIAPIINSEPPKEEEIPEEVEPTRNYHKMDKEILEMVGIAPLGEEVSDEEKAKALEVIKGWKDFTMKAEEERKAAELRNSFDGCIEGYEVEDPEALFEIFKENPELFAKTLNACGRKIRNEEPPKDEDKPSEEEPVKEELKEEKDTIPVEALNSKPVEMPKSARDKAMELHGQAFLDFVKNHRNELDN